MRHSKQIQKKRNKKLHNYRILTVFDQSNSYKWSKKIAFTIRSPDANWTLYFSLAPCAKMWNDIGLNWIEIIECGRISVRWLVAGRRCFNPISYMPNTAFILVIGNAFEWTTTIVNALFIWHFVWAILGCVDVRTWFAKKNHSVCVRLCLLMP